VAALLNERLCRSENWPGNLREAIHNRAIAQAMWELRHQQVLAWVLAALIDIGVQSVVIKGTALAYALYPDPMLRARSDTDIIIPPTERSRAHDLFTTLGFERGMAVSGELISYEASYTLTRVDTGVHNIDLHWRINNSELLARLFSYDELLEDAVCLPELCPEALGLCPVHALLVACMHRAMHKQNPYYVDGVAYYSADRLIWLYDIHLLTEFLSRCEWHDVLALAVDKGLCATCLDGIERARARFGTRCPDFVLTGLSGSVDQERPTTYLNGSKLRQQWMDFDALDGFASQLRFLHELIVPPAAYIRSKYPQAQRVWLPLLYARRAFDGLGKRLKTSRETK
jgi:hypothetical protein